MKTPIRKITLAVALATAGVAASAAEIVLFEHPGFAGRQVELRDFTPSVNGIGFNDRTSSVVVRSGRWEVCSDDNFKGSCAILEPGQYQRLDGRLNDRISSVREVGTTAARDYGRDRAPAHGSLQLFAAPGFGGTSLTLESSLPNLRASGYNDRASSVIVNDGTWVLCTDEAFAGNCRTYVPGRYPDLGYGLTKNITSARLVSDGPGSRSAYHRGGYERVEPNTTSTPITIYDREDFGGRSIALSGNNVDLNGAGFNDAASSMVISSGYWEFCSDAYYRGQCRIMGPGEYRRIDPALMNSVSSVRAATRAAPVAAGPRSEVELFTAPNFNGTRVMVNNDMRNFDAGGLNDRFSSVVINSGTWEICRDSNFSGNCSLFGPGRYSNLGGLTGQVSSMRRVYSPG